VKVQAARIAGELAQEDGYQGWAVRVSLSLPTAHIHVTTRTVFMTRPIALPFQIRDNARRAPSPQMS
jgi:hypothetical protein